MDAKENHDSMNRNRHKSDDHEQRLSPINVQVSQKSQENMLCKKSLENFSKCSHSCKYHCDVMSKGDHFQLLWQKSFACPVMGVDRVDIMGDGMEDLVVITLKGVHIIQVMFVIDRFDYRQRCHK